MAWVMVSTGPQFLTLTRLAARWACSTATLRRKIRRGELPVAKPTAGRALVPLSAVEAAERAVVRVPAPRLVTLADDSTSTATT